MKMTAKTNIKGVSVEFTFEGSIKEMLAVNTGMVTATKEWLDLFQSEGNRMFDLLDKAVDRVTETNKRIMIKDKELKNFEKIINKK